MPNIEIHGMTFGNAANLRERILQKFSAKPYAGDMAVSILKITVGENFGGVESFLRLIEAPEDYLGEIIKGLEEVGFSAELIKPAVFHPKSAGGATILSNELPPRDFADPYSPTCDVCGNLTERHGTCFKCMNCGNTMGCS